MYKIIIYLLFIIAFNFNSLAQRVYTDDVYLKKYEFPRREIKYKLVKTPFMLNDTTIISSNTVYVLEEYEEYEKKINEIFIDTSYKYIRFFNDGKFFISFSYKSFPSIEEFNDLTYGKFGYYTIENQEIILEYYYDREYRVQFWVCKPSQEGFQLFYLGKWKFSLFKRKGTFFGFYKKVYTTLYKWPD